MSLAKGTGFSTEIDGLKLKAEVLAEGWKYQITRIESGEVRKDWTMPLHSSVSAFAEPENTKFQAIESALLELRRTDDPYSVFRAVKWHPYGPPAK
jgi:hypothetical protein